MPRRHRWANMSCPFRAIAPRSRICVDTPVPHSVQPSMRPQNPDLVRGDGRVRDLAMATGAGSYADSWRVLGATPNRPVLRSPGRRRMFGQARRSRPLPASQRHADGCPPNRPRRPGLRFFRGSIPSPHAPRNALSHLEGLPTLALRRRRRTATARGRLGSLLPRRMALTSTTLRQLLALLPGIPKAPDPLQPHPMALSSTTLRR